MSATLPILTSVEAHLKAMLPGVEVAIFSDRPEQYRFMHPRAAILVGYQGSDFKKLDDNSHVVQERHVVLFLTLFTRGLLNDFGALDLNDKVRLALVGFKPEGCWPCHLMDEDFVTETGGAWQYQMRLRTETVQVQQVAAPNLPLFAQGRGRDSDEPLDSDLKPNPNSQGDNDGLSSWYGNQEN